MSGVRAARVRGAIAIPPNVVRTPDELARRAPRGRASVQRVTLPPPSPVWRAVGVALVVASAAVAVALAVLVAELGGAL